MSHMRGTPVPFDGHRSRFALTLIVHYYCLDFKVRADRPARHQNTRTLRLDIPEGWQRKRAAVGADKQSRQVVSNTLACASAESLQRANGDSRALQRYQQAGREKPQTAGR